MLIGYRAYGDFLYALPAIRQLLDMYDVHFEINGKGYELFHDDPRFAGITFFDVDGWVRKDPVEAWTLAHERWSKLEKEVGADRTINLFRTLETECIAEKYMPIFKDSVEKRRAKFGLKNFYEAVYDKCGLAMPDELDTEGLYYTDDQWAWAENWKKRHKDDFIIIMPIAGSCSHKVYPDMPKLTYAILDKYPNAVIYLAGDSSVAHAQWNHPRIHHTCGDISFKQMVLMTKYADYVFGGETGLVVAAGMWGTPKTMLCTASSVYQCCKYHKNDYSIQANIKCSPCHKAIYTVDDCDSMVNEDDVSYPKCITTFDFDKIMDTISEVYDLRQGVLRKVC